MHLYLWDSLIRFRLLLLHGLLENVAVVHIVVGGVKCLLVLIEVVILLVFTFFVAVCLPEEELLLQQRSVDGGDESLSFEFLKVLAVADFWKDGVECKLSSVGTVTVD